MKSYTLKAIAYIELIIGIIGSIVLGALFKTIDINDVLNNILNSEKTGQVEAKFNIGLTLGLLTSTIILFIILYALYSILSNIEAEKKDKTVENSAKLSNKPTNDLKKSVNSKITVKTSKAQSPEAKFAERYYWVCDNCLELNSKGTTVCRKCGKQKDEV